MNIKFYHFIFLLIMSDFVLGCSVLKKSKETTVKNQLQNVQWVLNNHNGSNKAYLIFHQNNFSGFGGCNRINGHYIENQSNNIQINYIISTKKYCSSTSPAEFSFLKLLRNSNRYEIKGNNLFLFRDKILLLKFESK